MCVRKGMLSEPIVVDQPRCVAGSVSIAPLRDFDVGLVDEHLEPGTPVVVGGADVVVAENIGPGAEEGCRVHDSGKARWTSWL